MRRWEYDIQQFNLVERWSAKKQIEERANLTRELTEKGSQGWELIGLHTFTLLGGITGAKKGEVTLTVWKREVSTN
jgi:hypothetical protein